MTKFAFQSLSFSTCSITSLFPVHFSFSSFVFSLVFSRFPFFSLLSLCF